MFCSARDVSNCATKTRTGVFHSHHPPRSCVSVCVLALASTNPLPLPVKPEWASCEESWQVKPGTTNAKISCRARMFPAGTTSKWSIGRKPNRTLLVNEDKNEPYKTEVKVSARGGDESELASEPETRTSHEVEIQKSYNGRSCFLFDSQAQLSGDFLQDLGGNTYEYILTISKVKTEHFSKHFQLEVQNALGKTEQRISLQEGKSAARARASRVHQQVHWGHGSLFIRWCFLCICHPTNFF